MCYDSFANIMNITISETNPTATKSSYVSINPADKLSIVDLNITTSPISIPENQNPSPTVVFSGREMYIEYPGLSQSACKQWTAPAGKKIYGFYVNYAVEKDYDYFVVSVDSVERLNVTGPNLGGEYIDISSTPGDVLSACVNADDAVQEGFGAQIEGVYYK